MTAALDGRGQPLMVLAIILGGWLVARTVLWEALPPALAGETRAPAPLDRSRAVAANLPGDVAGAVERRARRSIARADGQGLASMFASGAGALRRKSRTSAVTGPDFLAADPLALVASLDRPRPPDVALFHAPSESEPAPRLAPARPSAADRPLLGLGPARDEPAAKRWSGDAWLLWREGSTAVAAPGVTSYGRSQAGAVLRYRVAGQSPLGPMAYLRTSRALQGPPQWEAAGGLAIRPIGGLPVRVAAEARVTDTGSGWQVRPAAFAVTELPPATLPLGLRGEAYLQAGYVGGRYETAFVDGQARIDRRFVRFGSGGELRLGAAVWGGAQEGAERIDLGPSATVGFPIGEIHSRLALDYRVRVGGDSAPASGPALTFSAGF